MNSLSLWLELRSWRKDMQFLESQRLVDLLGRVLVSLAVVEEPVLMGFCQQSHVRVSTWLPCCAEFPCLIEYRYALNSLSGKNLSISTIVKYVDFRYQ